MLFEDVVFRGASRGVYTMHDEFGCEQMCCVLHDTATQVDE